MDNQLTGQAKWIWYPFDYEAWLGERVMIRRDYRGVTIPPFWRMDGHYQSVKFLREVNLEQDTYLEVEATGSFAFQADTEYLFEKDGRYTVPRGRHVLHLDVYAVDLIPAARVSGAGIVSDESWLVHNGDVNVVPVACGEYRPDGTYFDGIRFDERETFSQPAGENIWDFGKETFGYLRLTGIAGSGPVTIYYGESREEALSDDGETLDTVILTGQTEWHNSHSRACRYVRLSAPDTRIGGVSLMAETLPVSRRGRFYSSDPLLGRIWETAEYTFHLNTREFFLDGIKRDRWVWSGDAFQSFLINDYTFFDAAVSRRTLAELIGKPPFVKHINHIPDYSFFWFIGLYDYYFYTGDEAFVRAIFDRASAFMEFCLSRRDANGYIDSRADDWVFLDWAEMDKTGVLCAEQILFLRSVETMGLLSRRLGRPEAPRYEEIFRCLKPRIFRDFWTEREGLRHSDKPHKPTKYANVFALMFGYLNAEQQAVAVRQSLLNPSVMDITTPYAKFYKLDALCRCGGREEVLREIRAYWGGMLREGATSFWEEYDPLKTGAEHYAMYGRPFGKSLCHAWGASPLYLLGRYFLGVRPLEPGYERYEIDMFKGDLEFISGTVPTPKGDIRINYSDTRITVHGIRAKGILTFSAKRTPCDTRCRRTADGRYVVDLPEDGEYSVELS